MADNLGTLLADACRKFAAQPALEEKNDTLSYSQLSALSDTVASVLRGHGLMRDEPVLVPVGQRGARPCGIYRRLAGRRRGCAGRSAFTGDSGRGDSRGVRRTIFCNGLG